MNSREREGEKEVIKAGQEVMLRCLLQELNRDRPAYLEPFFLMEETKGREPGIGLKVPVGEGVTGIASVGAESLYRAYMNGAAIGELKESIVSRIGQTVKKGSVFRPEDFTKASFIRERLFLRLISAEKAERQGLVCRRIGDMAAALYLRISEGEGDLISAGVRPEMASGWELERKEAFELALLNTQRENGARVLVWENGFQGEKSLGDPLCLSREDVGLAAFSRPGLCLTTEKRTNGATAVLYDGVLSSLADTAGEDLYLSFTSIHEVILHRVSDVSLSAIEAALTATLEEVTGPEDYLTSRVYRYERDSGRLTPL